MVMRYSHVCPTHQSLHDKYKLESACTASGHRATWPHMLMQLWTRSLAPPHAFRFCWKLATISRPFLHTISP